MGERARRLVVDALEQMTMLDDGTSSSHTALKECLPSSSRHDVALGDCNTALCSMEPKSDYFSPRVEKMMRSKSQFSSDVEHEIEYSREHWSEVPGLSKLSKEDDHDDEEEETCLSELSKDNDHDDEEEEEEVTQENREVFAELMNDPQWRDIKGRHFFQEWPSYYYKLGGKIAEGGQATIFEVLVPDGNVYNNFFLMKVFKRGSRLSDLKKQWPHGILRGEVGICVVWRGCMLDDGRFAFMMLRCWGDLRKLIDQAMQEKNNQGPPFPYKWNGNTLLAKEIMSQIAARMVYLHEKGIIHRDLKAANVLLLKRDQGPLIIPADFECSIGVVGTRFWRAPEILSALKHRNAIDFTEKMDVYSFGMICFEVVTGRLPFEGELKACRDSYDLVIGGRRPKLPCDLDVPLKDLIERCWNPIPNERPNFVEIRDVLRHLN